MSTINSQDIGNTSHGIQSGIQISRRRSRQEDPSKREVFPTPLAPIMTMRGRIFKSIS